MPAPDPSKAEHSSADEVRFEDRVFSFQLLASDSVSEHLAETGSFYEEEFLRALKTVLDPETTVFDVGAHIGNHTVFFAGVLGLRVVAFEPNPKAFEALEQNVRDNGLSELVECIPKAVSETGGVSSMRPTAEGDQGTMAIAPPEADPTLTVEMTTLDDYVGRVTAPVYVKVDVEGHERSVVKGGRRFLSELSPEMSLEVHSVEDLDRLVEELSPSFLPVAVFNATPTVLFRSNDSPTVSSLQTSLVRYAVSNAMAYLQRRNWFQAERHRADEYGEQLRADRAQLVELRELSDDFRIELKKKTAELKKMTAELKRLRQEESQYLFEKEVANGLVVLASDFDIRYDLIGWLEDLRRAHRAGQDESDIRVLMVNAGQSPLPVALISLLFKVVDLVDCHIQGPFRFRRFARGRVVLDTTDISSTLDLGMASVSLLVDDGVDQYGNVDVVIIVAGEEAPECEARLLSMTSGAIILVVRDAAYSYARLTSLMAADAIYLASQALREEWETRQLLPATPIGISPTAMAAGIRATVNARQEVGQSAAADRPATESTVLLVSYYAPPSTPVSVQRLSYWHRELASIAADFGQSLSSTWLTATAQAAGNVDTKVVVDRGPWALSNEWLDRYRAADDLQIDSMGISWAGHIRNSIQDLGGPYTTVIISGNPFHYFDLARVFKEEWLSKVILDFRDPFAYNPRYKFTQQQREYLIELERGWVATADAVISVNQDCLDTVAPGVAAKRVNIANGFDESLVDSIGRPDEMADDLVHIAYSGTVFANLPLDDVLAAIPDERMLLHHFGRDYSASQSVSHQRAGVFEGLVPYAELVTRLRGYHAGLIMTGGEASTQTTKLFDYLACDLDIIIVTSGRPKIGNLHEITSELDGVYWVRNSPSELRKFFSTYVPSNVVRPQRSQFSRRHQAIRLFELIRELEMS